MEIVDRTGSPRSNQDIGEAIDAIKKELVRGQVNPAMIFYPTIIDALIELLQRRITTKDTSITNRKRAADRRHILGV